MRIKINIPNALSIGRILLIPFLMLLIVYNNEKNYPLLIQLFLLSILLDFLDGFLARKLHQETELGMILDPLADKLLIFFIIFALVLKADFPLWLALVVFFRDFVILIASTLLMKIKHKVKPSILIGKVTFGVLGGLLMIYIVDLSEKIDLEILKRYFIVLSFCFILWSWVEYYQIYKKEKDAR